MGIVVIPLSVLRADPDAPSAVLVPAEGFHRAGLHRHNRRTEGTHHVVAQVPPPESVIPPCTEVVAVRIIVTCSNGRKSLDSIGWLPFPVHIDRIGAHQPAEDGCVRIKVIPVSDVGASRISLGDFPATRLL